jgi:uracil-DNA glycosylase
VSDKQARLDAIAEDLRGHVPCGFAICEEATNLVPGEGNPDADVVFVGEAPGANEDKHGRPFIGSAGKLLDELLAEAGLVRGDIFITNVVKARPPKNRDPKADEIAHHLPWLTGQLDVIEPHFVVPLGRHALSHFAPEAKIGEAHGTVIETGTRTVFPMYHPAAAIYNRSLRETLSEDARKLAEALAAR